MQQALSIIDQHAREGAELRLNFFQSQAHTVASAALCMARSLAAGGKILACGNGGSAADAQHLTGELVGRFLIERPALPAVALTVDSSILTAVGNDYGYERIFARQVEALGKPGDVLLAISTSGNSPNILAALHSARAAGMHTVGLTGKGGGHMRALCDTLINVDHAHTPLIQEVHASVVHLLCQLIDFHLFENPLSLEREL